jgi:hypothetical protein
MTTKYQLTPADRSIIEGLKAEEIKEGGAAEFVRAYLPFSASKWSKILNSIDPEAKASYFDDLTTDSARRVMLDELAGILENIPRLRAQAERLNSQDLYDLSQFRAVKVAVEEAGGKRSPERLVKYLAPTGGGKSMLCSYLAKKCSAKVTESREAWKRSYYTVLEDLSKALGCRLSGETRPAAVEDRLCDFLGSQKTVLAIDEGEFFGPAAINGLKLLLNRTRLVLVLCAIGEAHDRWNRYFPLEASQLDRRTHAVVRLTQPHVDDIKKFFPSGLFDNEPAALARVAEEAARFGQYSLVARVAALISRKEKVESKELDTAIRKSLKDMNRTPSR